MKKTTLLLATATLALSLCACGGKKAEQVTSPSDAATDSDASVATATDGSSDATTTDGEITFTSGLHIENNDVYDGERREFKYDKLLASFGELEIYGDDMEDIVCNIEGVVSFRLLFKNAGDIDMSVSLNDYTLSGDFMECVTHDETLLHPNGAPNYYLAPGEEVMVQADMAPLFDVGSPDNQGDINLDLIISIVPAGGQHRVETLRISENVTYASRETFESATYNNATISGIVQDEEGNPIADAKVEVLTSLLTDTRIEGSTKDDGSYSITVPAGKSVYSNAWREAALILDVPGYAQRCIPIYPKNNQTVTADVTLYNQTKKLVYEQTNEVDLGIQAYENDTDGETLVFVPFHSEYNPEDVADDIKATVTDFDGNVLYTYNLPQEIPYVDISDNGKYVVMPVDYIGGGFKIVVLDQNGNEFYSTTLEETKIKYAPSQSEIDTDRSRCAQLSGDNKYLAVSDTLGDFWLIDMEQDKVVFNNWTMAQVRNIKFNEDNTELYVSDGAGTLINYDINGNILWQSNITSWATEMELTEKYIVCTTKSAGDNLHVISRETGEILWDYPTLQSSKGLAISPDEKYIWYGAHASSAYSLIGSSIFDIETGELVAFLGTSNAQAAAFSQDGSKIVVRSRENVTVYDAKNGAKLFSQAFDSRDYTGNFTAFANADMSKFVYAAYNPEREGNYGKAYYFNYVGEKEYDPEEEAAAEAAEEAEAETKEYYRIRLSAVNVIDFSLNKYGDVIAVYDIDGNSGEIVGANYQVIDCQFVAALKTILYRIGGQGNLRRTDSVDLEVLKVVESQVEHLPNVLQGAEDTIRSVGEEDGLNYNININDSDYEIVQKPQ